MQNVRKFLYEISTCAQNYPSKVIRKNISKQRFFFEFEVFARLFKIRRTVTIRPHYVPHLSTHRGTWSTARTCTSCAAQHEEAADWRGIEAHGPRRDHAQHDEGVTLTKVEVERVRRRPCGVSRRSIRRISLNPPAGRRRPHDENDSCVERERFCVISTLVSHRGVNTGDSPVVFTVIWVFRGA